MWGQLVRISQQSLFNFMTWGQANGPLLTIAFVAAWLFGMDRGLQGRVLRVKVASGMLCAYVGTPLILYYLGLSPEIWKAAVGAFISINSWRIAKWAEMLLMRKMGIERRKEDKEQDF